MIPLRDVNPTRITPFVTWALIAACTWVFVQEWLAGPALDAMIDRHALIPARMLGLARKLGPLHPEVFAPLLSSQFLHAGLGHFAGNMWFLWIFGDNVEERLGHVGFLAFYLAGGVFAGLAHAFSDAGSVVPTLGASGAIAAVMGAYIVLHPRARVESLVILGFAITTLSVPAFVYLGIWAGMQLLLGLISDASGGGVAWWAHAGGFAFGAGGMVVLGRRGRRR